MSTYSLQIKKIRPYNRDILRLKSTDIPPSLDGYSVTYAMIQSPTRYTGDTTIGEFNGTLNMPSGIQNNTITWTNTDWSPAQKGQTIIVDRCTLPLYPTTVTWYITYNVTTFNYSILIPKLIMGSTGTVSQLSNFGSNASVHTECQWTTSQIIVTIVLNNFPNLPFAQNSNDETDGKHVVFIINNVYQKSSTFSTVATNLYCPNGTCSNPTCNNPATPQCIDYNIIANFYNGPNTNAGSYKTSKNYFLSGNYILYTSGPSRYTYPLDISYLQ